MQVEKEICSAAANHFEFVNKFYIIYHFVANFQAQSQKINLLSSSILDWTPYTDLGDKLWTSYTDMSDNLWTSYTNLSDNLWTSYINLGDNRHEDFEEKVKNEDKNEIFHDFHHAHNFPKSFLRHIHQDESSCDSPFKLGGSMTCRPVKRAAAPKKNIQILPKLFLVFSNKVYLCNYSTVHNVAKKTNLYALPN